MRAISLDCAKWNWATDLCQLEYLSIAEAGLLQKQQCVVLISGKAMTVMNWWWRCITCESYFSLAYWKFLVSRYLEMTKQNN